MDPAFKQTLEKNLQKAPPTKFNTESKEMFKGIDNEFHGSSEEDPYISCHLAKYGILAEHKVFRNAPVPVLYEQALRYEKGTKITSTGALATLSGAKTGRSPQDKRIVDEESTNKDVWWGSVNIKLSEHAFMVNRERAVDYLNTREFIYVMDGFAGWDEQHRIKVRVIGSRAYWALFMHDMLIRPTKEQLDNFGEPDYVIYNAGEFPANTYTEGMSSSTSVALNFKRREMVILGTQYAGEMKKGVFTIMNYLMPKAGVLSLHSSCNEGKNGDVTLFFGLSGTGKTTLSADPHRYLIGDDEHVWTEKGVFNIEGGCYAKCIGLKQEKEPEIFNAIKFGSVVENVVMDEKTREINYDSDKITENTRCAYPLEYIPNAKLPAITNHPSNIVLLALDAFGVLPPVSKLSVEQCMYHFIAGYTSKVAGTEVGIKEPVATFSACFGEPFIVWHPVKYATLLAEKLKKHNAQAWLVNTGWVGGSPAQGGHRIALKYSRAIVDAINTGALAKSKTVKMGIFGFEVPTECPGVPEEVLLPHKAWKNQKDYDTVLLKLAKMFVKNFEKYSDQANAEILRGGPVLPEGETLEGIVINKSLIG